MSESFYDTLATWSQIVASVLFVVVMVVLWQRFVAPAVLASQARKNAELADAEARRDVARRAIDDARREVSTAETDARAIDARAASDAESVRARIVAEGAAEAVRVVRNAEGELERGRLFARERLRADLLAKAVAIARDAARNVDSATDRRLVSEAVDVVDREAT